MTWEKFLLRFLSVTFTFELNLNLHISQTQTLGGAIRQSLIFPQGNMKFNINITNQSNWL